LRQSRWLQNQNNSVCESPLLGEDAAIKNTFGEAKQEPKVQTHQHFNRYIDHALAELVKSFVASWPLISPVALFVDQDLKLKVEFNGHTK
tara:strand:- start:142 stop:411 length:270 start_codon:yes stop_codon:yes gene_type:complete